MSRNWSEPGAAYSYSVSPFYMEEAPGLGQPATLQTAPAYRATAVRPTQSAPYANGASSYCSEAAQRSTVTMRAAEFGAATPTCFR